jgi:hypothetical protein
MASIDDDSPIRITEFEERQRLKQTEDRILDLLVIMESTLDTIDSLSQAYRDFCLRTTGALQQSPISDNDLICFALAERRRDVLSYRSKVEALRAKVKGTTKLVSSTSSPNVYIVTETIIFRYLVSSTSEMAIL